MRMSPGPAATTCTTEKGLAQQQPLQSLPGLVFQHRHLCAAEQVVRHRMQIGQVVYCPRLTGKTITLCYR